MKAVYLNETGAPGVLVYGDLPDPKPSPNDVLIRVRATSLDRLDMFTRQGSHGTSIVPPHILGRDIAGDVAEFGAEVQGLALGQRVVASGTSSNAEYALAQAATTFPIPEGCSYTEAAALPTAGSTAYEVLMHRAQMRAGEDVLVIAAASGVGHFAVQIAKAAGGRVIATAGSDDKLAKARAIGADFTINHYTEDITNLVMEFTDGRGVDVVVEHVGTPVWRACIDSLKPYGRFVTCGVTAGHKVELHLGRVFTSGIQIMGVGRRQDALPGRSLAGLLRLVANGRVTPIIHATHPLKDAEEAHRMMENADFFGKIVLTV